MGRHLLALLLAVCVLVPAGCGKKTPGRLEKEPLTGTLTGVYRGEDFALPDGWTVYAGILPVYPDGITRLVGVRRTELQAADGTIADETAYAVFTLADGKPADSVPLAVSGERNLETGAFSGGGDWLACLLDERADHGEKTLVSYDLTTGEEKTLEHVQNFLPSLAAGPYANVAGMAVDAEGRIAVAVESEIAVFDAGLLFRYIVSVSGHVISLAALGDGRFWVSTHEGIAPAEEEGLGESIPIPNTWSRIVSGNGYDFYASAPEGVYGVNFAESGIGYDLLMDYMNSDVSGLLFLGAADPDTLLFSTGIYRRAPDIDLSAIRTLEMTYAKSPGMNLPYLIAEFNRTHDDARIVTRDYSVYQTDSDPDGAIRRLSTDIASGILKPDIVIGSHDASFMRHIYDEELWIDLVPFTEGDPLVNRDNVFGAVWKSFLTDGKLWALPAGYMIAKLITTVPSAAGEGRDRWTVAEFLDFAESLPEDTMLMENLTQESRGMLLSAESMNGFIDRGGGTCSFDSPEFVRLLNWFSALPKDKTDLQKRYPEIMNAGRDERTRFYREGKIALFSKWITDFDELFTLSAKWGTEDWKAVGSPVPEGVSGIGISPLNVMTATRYCAEPELAWEFIRSVYESMEGAFAGGILPLTKSCFDRTAEQMQTMEYAVYYDGSRETRLKSEGEPLTLRQQGMILEFTAETAEKLKTILDTAGSPVMESIPDEVNAIIDEEISTFLAGAASAEDCAKKIQSRVSIWLAENK